MKNIRNFVVLLSIVASAGAANAQAAHGTFQLTSETRWGTAVLPAGHYSFTLDSLQAPIVIHSDDCKLSVMVMAEVGGPAESGGSYIQITATSRNRRVRVMNLPQIGYSLVFQPLTRAERETLSAIVSETVPVQLAKK